MRCHLQRGKHAYAPEKPCSVAECLLGVLNWVDFLAIAPYYIELFISGAPGLAWIRVIRLTRVFRVFKVGRFQVHSRTGTQREVVLVRPFMPFLTMGLLLTVATVWVPLILLHIQTKY